MEPKQPVKDYIINIFKKQPYRQQEAPFASNAQTALLLGNKAGYQN